MMAGYYHVIDAIDAEYSKLYIISSNLYLYVNVFLQPSKSIFRALKNMILLAHCKS